ncbi:CoA ester lyase [Humibacillus sp. DSM 29435]|uniref:HpcH/HpaI aldolase/citrate lyase family protein n=1 Tax=Humibacillus sp. DSM 29435 TaxID=1869167 RepID=UPI0009F16E39|nr:CoA ester lyase [Humibacillus sp. DSM 29435]
MSDQRYAAHHAAHHAAHLAAAEAASPAGAAGAATPAAGWARALSAAALLFVPGDRPERFDKAVAGSDLAILDLEAAVTDDAKAPARENIRAWLEAGGVAAVRVNVPGSDEHVLDLAALRGAPGVVAVVVPLAEDVDALGLVAEQVGAPVIALVESALGVDRARELAAADAVVRLAFGSLDYSLDVDAVESRESLLFARSTLVVASRVAGIAAPIDTVTTDVSPDGPVSSDAAHARGLGFSGKLCIHPAQVAAVRAAFRPDADEIAWATRVLAATPSRGAVKVDGHMVDAPVLERARRVLARATPETSGPSGPSDANDPSGASKATR